MTACRRRWLSFLVLAPLSFTIVVASVAMAPTASAAGQVRYLDSVFGSVSVTKDLVYGHAPVGATLAALKLDLYQPNGDTAAARPVVVYAHGGAFVQGDKQGTPTPSITKDLARHGFVVASINYRLTGSAEDATHDMMAAVRWVRANAGLYRLDPVRVVVMGSSAGAQMALMANFNPDDTGDSGNPGYSSRVAGGLAISWSTQTGIDPGDPPIAVFQAVDDTANPFPLSETMCLETQALLNVCAMNRYTEGGHGANLILAHQPEIVAGASDFLCRQVLGPAMCTPR